MARKPTCEELEQRAKELEERAIECKEIEKMLEESEEKYRRLVDNANEAIFVARDGVLQFANPKTMEITGYSEDELFSTRFADLCHPEDREMVLDRSVRRQNGESVVNMYPFRLVRKDREVRWVEANAVLICWEGRPATLNLLNDITKRKQAEEALKKSEATARALLNAPDDVALLIDPDSTIVALNEIAAKALGKSPDELIGTCVLDGFPPEVAEFRKAQGLKVIRSGKPVHFEDQRDGKWFDQSVYPIFDSQGKVVRVAVFAHDITELKETAQSLRQREKELEIKTESLEELNTALRVLLKRREEDKTEGQYPLDLIL